MPSFTKGEIVNDAYSQLRISGITVDATPEDIALAVDRLDDMMSEFFGRNMCLNYEFEENPSPTTFHGVDRQHHLMMASNLAMTLLQDFGKDAPMALRGTARSTYDTSSAVSAVAKIRQVQYPSRMPRGSGIRRFNRWRRFHPANNPPVTSCFNFKMFLGDVKDIVEPFIAYLEGETIASYTISTSAGLTISNDTNLGDTLTYRVTAASGSSVQTKQTITVVITTSTGRITTKERTVELEDRAQKP